MRRIFGSRPIPTAHWIPLHIRSARQLSRSHSSFVIPHPKTNEGRWGGLLSSTSGCSLMEGASLLTSVAEAMNNSIINNKILLLSTNGGCVFNSLFLYSSLFQHKWGIQALLPSYNVTKAAG